MRVSILVFALLTTSACASPSPLTPSAGPWRFSGTVSRIDSTQVRVPIAGAELTILSGVNINVKVTTDISGRYVFNALDSGRFTLVVAAPGYRSATPVVDLYCDIDANFGLRPQ